MTPPRNTPSAELLLISQQTQIVKRGLGDMRGGAPSDHCIETPRLLLRPYLLQDAARYSELANDEQVQQFDFGVQLPFKIADAENRIKQFTQWRQEGSYFSFVVIDKSLKEMVGGISVLVNRAHELGEFGYWLGHAYWNRGIATEAVCGLMRYCFDHLQLQKLISQSLPENIGSMKVQQKLCMPCEGVLKSHWIKNGRRHDLAQYRMLRSEWLALGYAGG